MQRGIAAKSGVGQQGWRVVDHHFDAGKLGECGDPQTDDKRRTQPRLLQLFPASLRFTIHLVMHTLNGADLAAHFRFCFPHGIQCNMRFFQPLFADQPARAFRQTDHTQQQDHCRDCRHGKHGAPGPDILQEGADQCRSQDAEADGDIEEGHQATTFIRRGQFSDINWHNLRGTAHREAQHQARYAQPGGAG